MIPLEVIKALVTAGVTDVTSLVTALEAIASNMADEKPKRSAGAERTARYRQKKKEASPGVTPVTSQAVTAPLPNKEGRVSHTLPKEEINQPHTHTRARDEFAVEFEKAFWPGWPHKVGKPKALLAFLAARRTFSLEAIISGRDRYVAAKPPGRDWLNPATFLNQERFNDEPAANPVPAVKERPHDALFRALAEIAEGGTGFGGGEVGSDGSPAVARVAESPYREPDQGSGKSAHPLRIVSGDYGGRDREAYGGIPDADYRGFSGGFARSGIFRGLG